MGKAGIILITLSLLVTGCLDRFVEHPAVHEHQKNTDEGVDLANYSTYIVNFETGFNYTVNVTSLDERCQWEPPAGQLNRYYKYEGNWGRDTEWLEVDCYMNLTFEAHNRYAQEEVPTVWELHLTGEVRIMLNVAIAG